LLNEVLVPSFRRICPRILPLWLGLLLVACQGPSTSGPPDELLAIGLKAYDSADFSTASTMFSAVRQKHPESAQDEQASIMFAETKRRQRYGGSSFKAYKDFATRYPNSRYAVMAAEGEYHLGNAYYDKTLWGFLFFKPDPVVGAQVMEHMQVHYRNHSLAQEALMDTGEFFLKKKKWEGARTYFKQLLAEYPRSRHVLRARFQFSRAVWEMSEGPDYDERLMLQSKRGFRDFKGAVRAAGKEVEMEKQLISADQFLVKIDEQLAKKQYRIGRFYERTKAPTSALHYYRYCLTEYPDTKAAKKCAKRIRPVEAKIAEQNQPTEQPAVPADKEAA